MKVGGTLYTKEYYTGFYVLKIGKGIKKLTVNANKEEVQSELSVTNFRIQQNTFRTPNMLYPHFKSYVDYEDVCDLVKSPIIYNVYRRGRFFDAIPLASTKNGVVERVESEYHVATTMYRNDNNKIKKNKNIPRVQNVFHMYYRTMIGKLFSNKKDYRIEVNPHRVKLNVTGLDITVVIFNIDNPEVDVFLSTKFDEVCSTNYTY
ncbi:unnamed protein product [Gordionus sp. m RMFG-2023]